MRWRLPLALLMALGMLAGACADNMEGDARAATVARAPADALARIPRESRRYWLLMGTAGWCGAYLTRYGGEADDPGVAVVRVARFRDSGTAARAFAGMDAEYLYRVFAVKMLKPPQMLAYPEPLAGDESFAISYPARLPFDLPPGISVEGQMVAVRAGQFVTLIETIGVSAEQMAQAVAAIADAARTEARPGC